MSRIFAFSIIRDTEIKAQKTVIAAADQWAKRTEIGTLCPETTVDNRASLDTGTRSTMIKILMNDDDHTKQALNGQNFLSKI
ncbi:unnamed protein product [Orchesella dallaii]|uniref:Uncharacterized protein n=1 Tax=Orchesella dallaii TaxID=48710 RepID=A0ABP1S9V6_9HEXA